VLDLLTSLADKNLVVAEERNGVTRYRLLETVRQYARDLLLTRGEEAHWQERHLSYFVSIAEEAEQQLTGADQQSWLDQLDTEHDNLRSALAWSATTRGNAIDGLRLAGALWRFWYVRGYLNEGRRWLSGMLAAAAAGPSAPTRAKALHGAGALAWQQGNYAAARTLHEEALAMRRQLHDRQGIASSLNSMGLVARDQGDLPAARALYEEALAMWRQLGDRRGIAVTLNNLGLVVRHQSDYPIARAMYEESLAIVRERGDRRGMAVALNNLGNVVLEEGNFPAARTLYNESLEILRELVDRDGIAASLEGLAHVAFPLAGPSKAARIWGGAERLREQIGAPMPPGNRPSYARQIAAARTALGDDAAFEQAWQEGRAMTLEQAIDYALHENAGNTQSGENADGCEHPPSSTS